jgi:predicted enzyme related to lactoylglutathione lyase
MVVLFTAEGQDDRIGSSFNGAFHCDDLDRTYQELVSRGVEFSKPPTRQPWGAYASFKDPDGNEFVLSAS